VRRCQHRPIAHVAAEASVSRQCLGKWVARYREHGEAGLVDRSSAPANRPTRTPAAVAEQIAALRKKKWSARRITLELSQTGTAISVATVTRWLHRLGVARLDHLDADGEPLRAPGKITARYPGHMIHVDVKKVGRIPDGGGWRVHGRDSAQQRAADRAKTGGARAGYTYLHSAVDGFSRLAYTEPLLDETAASAIAFLSRARAFFSNHGITRFTRIVTDNGSCYRSFTFAAALTVSKTRHKRTRPYRPQTNGKVERYHRTLAQEWAYAHAWTSNQHRAEALHPFLDRYNYRRPHTALGGRPPVTRTTVTNLAA
jgi:transposase InsO family protein